MERKKRGGRFFIGIVVIEHIVFALLMALAIAPKSPPRPKETAINVDIIKTETPRKKINTEIPIAVPNVRQSRPSDTLPQIQATTNIRDYLATTQTEGGLPNLRRTQASSENPDRLSLGAPPSKGRSKGDFLDEPNALVRSKPLDIETGYHGRDSHRGLPERDARRSITGESGKALAGRFAPGKLSGVKTNLITEGVPYEISGEVSGRAVISGLERSRFSQSPTWEACPNSSRAAVCISASKSDLMEACSAFLVDCFNSSRDGRPSARLG